MKPRSKRTELEHRPAFDELLINEQTYMLLRSVSNLPFFSFSEKMLGRGYSAVSSSIVQKTESGSSINIHTFYLCSKLKKNNVQ